MRELAAFVGCRAQDLALVPNATTGLLLVCRLCLQPAPMPAWALDSWAAESYCLPGSCCPLFVAPFPAAGLNSVIQSMRGRVGPGETLFSLDVGYGSVKKMLAVVAEQTGAQHVQHTVQLPLRWVAAKCPPARHGRCALPLNQPRQMLLRLPDAWPAACSSAEELVAQVAAAMPAGTKLAVFDAVTSNTAIRLPIQQLVQLCHSRWAGRSRGTATVYARLISLPSIFLPRQTLPTPAACRLCAAAGVWRCWLMGRMRWACCRWTCTRSQPTILSPIAISGCAPPEAAPSCMCSRATRPTSGPSSSRTVNRAPRWPAPRPKLCIVLCPCRHHSAHHGGLPPTPVPTCRLWQRLCVRVHMGWVPRLRPPAGGVDGAACMAPAGPRGGAILPAAVAAPGRGAVDASLGHRCGCRLHPSHLASSLIRQQTPREQCTTLPLIVTCRHTGAAGHVRLNGAGAAARCMPGCRTIGSRAYQHSGGTRCYLGGRQVGAGLSALPAPRRVPHQVHQRLPLCPHLWCVMRVASAAWLSLPCHAGQESSDASSPLPLPCSAHLQRACRL